MHLNQCRKTRLCYSIFFVLLFCTKVGFAAEDVSLLVDTQWVKENLNDDELIIIDTRNYSAYKKGHIPYAINIPVELTFSPYNEANHIGPIAQITELFNDRGLKNSDHVVLYDSGRLTDAARFFWVLEVYGHHKISILDGGLAQWRNENLSLKTADVTREKSVYVPNISTKYIANQLSTRIAMKKKSVSIIDARSIEEYKGKISVARRFGHIPSAINIPWHKHYEYLGNRMLLRSDKELQQLYSSQNINMQVIAYCNRGKQSALTYFVLRKLGYGVSVYDGAWLEWGNDDSLPVTKMNTSIY